MFQTPQALPAVQRHVRFRSCADRRIFPLRIHAGKYRVQHRQKQPQHRHILRGQFASQAIVFVRMQQGIRQRHLPHGTIRTKHPHPGFVQ